MKRLALFAAAFGSFWIFAPFMPLDYVFVAVSSLTFAIAMGVTLAYIGGAARAVSAPRISAAHLLVLGVAIAWASNAARSMWVWALRYLDRPEWMQDSLVPAWLIWMLFWAGVFHLAASNAIDGEVPTLYWRKIGIIVAIGMSIALALIYLASARAGNVSEDILKLLTPTK